MEDNGFLYLALICTSVVLEPLWFFGDLTHSSCFVSPSSHALGGMLGTVGIQRTELSCACFGMVDGDTVLVAKCQGVAGSRRASATSFPKGCVGLIIAPLSSHFSKSQFLKEPKSPGISRRRVNPEQPPGIHPTSVPVAKPISRLGVQSHWEFVPFIYMDGLVWQ